MTAPLLALNNAKDLDTSQYQRAIALRVAESVGCRDALDLVQVARFVMDGRDPWALTDHLEHTEPIGVVVEGEGRSTGPHLHFELPDPGTHTCVTDRDRDMWKKADDGTWFSTIAGLDNYSWANLRSEYGPLIPAKESTDA